MFVNSASAKDDVFVVQKAERERERSALERWMEGDEEEKRKDAREFSHFNFPWT